MKLFIQDKERRDNLRNLVEQTSDWRKELTWVGKDGLIIFDDIGYGAIQDRLRKQGYTVFGGSALGDRLEEDRYYAQKIFSQHGMRIAASRDFEKIEDAITFVGENPRAWVVKQHDGAAKMLNYVGVLHDGSDVLTVLKNYQSNNLRECEPIHLQEKIEGIEIGCARYFNGKDWVGPIEMNIEHKKFFPGNIGPTTSEMGTLAWYDDKPEANKLFQETLALLKPHLIECDFRGDIDINCIVNETGAYPLEATPRFGSPIIQLHSELHRSPWGEFLHAVASGQNYDLDWNNGYGIVVLLAVPPFPYASKIRSLSSKGMKIYFGNDFTENDRNHIHYETVSSHGADDLASLYVSDNDGYVLSVTGLGDTVEEARENTYALVRKIIIPKMFYRDDIGESFIKRDKELLKAWGYL